MKVQVESEQRAWLFLGLQYDSKEECLPWTWRLSRVSGGEEREGHFGWIASPRQGGGDPKGQSPCIDASCFFFLFLSPWKETSGSFWFTRMNHLLSGWAWELEISTGGGSFSVVLQNVTHQAPPPKDAYRTVHSFLHRSLTQWAWAPSMCQRTKMTQTSPLRSSQVGCIPPLQSWASCLTSLDLSLFIHKNGNVLNTTEHLEMIEMGVPWWSSG